MELVIASLLIYLLASMAIAHYVGRHYRIGFVRSLIFSLANPLLGYWLTIQSGKKGKKFNPYKAKG